MILYTKYSDLTTAEDTIKALAFTNRLATTLTCMELQETGSVPQMRESHCHGLQAILQKPIFNHTLIGLPEKSLYIKQNSVNMLETEYN